MWPLVMSFSQSYFHGRTSSAVCELQTSQNAEGPGTGGHAAGHEALERGWEGEGGEGEGWP